MGRAVSQNLNQLIVITLKFDYSVLDLNNVGIGFLSCDMMFSFDNSKNKNMSHYLPWLSLYSFPTFVCPILFSL